MKKKDAVIIGKVKRYYVNKYGDIPVYARSMFQDHNAGYKLMLKNYKLCNIAIFAMRAMIIVLLITIIATIGFQIKAVMPIHYDLGKVLKQSVITFITVPIEFVVIMMASACIKDDLSYLMYTDAIGWTKAKEDRNKADDE